MPRIAPLVLAAGVFCAVALAPRVSGAKESDTIVARVGDQIITSDDIDDAVQPVADAMDPGEASTPEGKQKLAEARANVLDHMIEVKLVVLAAEAGPPGYADAVKDDKTVKNPYLPEASDVETEMEHLFDQTRHRFPDNDAFEAALGREHLSVPEYRDQLRRRVREQMTYERMERIKEEEFRPSLRVSTAEARAYYDSNKASFYQGPEVYLRHILFGPDELARARHYMALLKAKPARERKAAFIALAREHSEDGPTRDQGGLLGWIQKGQSWPELEAIAFAAKNDTLAGPVKTQAGWHLLYVEAHRPGKQLGFDAVKKDVENLVYQDKVQKRMNDWIDELKTQYYVERKADASP